MANVPVKDVLKKVRQTFQQVDEFATEKAKRMKATCKFGCSACCYQLVSISFIEALVIADYLVRNRSMEQLTELKVKLREQSGRLRFKENRRTLFEARVPCVFLKMTDGPYVGECEIYRSRPLACRLQYVISDPEHCSPDSIVTGVDLVDMTQPHSAALKVICGGVPMLASHGPLAPMVLLALESAETGKNPSELDLEYWRRRTGAMLRSASAEMERHGIQESYVDEEQK